MVDHRTASGQLRLYEPAAWAAAPIRGRYPLDVSDLSGQHALSQTLERGREATGKSGHELDARILHRLYHTGRVLFAGDQRLLAQDVPSGHRRRFHHFRVLDVLATDDDRVGQSQQIVEVSDEGQPRLLGELFA